MEIIVAGCGKIGRTIIGSLVAEGHDVIAVDSDKNVIDEITDLYDIMTICGNCANYDILEESSVKSAELFVAVTGSDELNMLSCYIAKKNGCKPHNRANPQPRV